MNRYTQLSTTQFNPLSMEEMSILPAMMRQRHDAASLEMEKRRADLNAFAISSPEYSQEAQALIAQMNKGIDDISGSLASNGYNSLTRTNLSNMNRDYQQLVSPTGRLGQMTNAEKLNAERYKEHLEAAQKEGYGTDAAMRNWALNKKNYTGYDNEGNITAVNSLGVPKYANMITDLKDIKGILGESQRRVDSAGGGNIHIRNDGSAWVVNKSGSVQRITNDPQLNQALEFLKTKWLSPDGEGFKSAMYQGKNLNNILSELNSGINAMRVDKIIDNTNYSGSLSGYKNPKDGDGDGSGNPLSSLISANTIHGRVGSEHMSNINTVNTRLNALSKIPVGERSLTQQAEIESLSRAKSDQKLYLENHKDYQKLKSQYEAEAKKSGYSTNKSLEEIYKLPHIKNETDPKMKAALVSAESDKNKANPKLVELQRKMNSIESSFKPKAIESDLYSIVDTGKSGDKRIIEGLDSSFASVLKSGNFATGNNFDIASITFDGKTRGQGTSFDLKDKQEIQKVISGTSRENIKTIGVRPIGTSGLVEYEIEITPQKGNKGNINRLLRSEKGSGTIGDGKSFILNVVTNVTSDKAGINTIAGYTTRYFANRGAEGKQVADMMIGNMNRSNVNTTFKADSSGEPVTYGQFFNNPKNYYSDENSLRAVQDMIITDAFETQYRNGYFGDKDMKDITEKERERAVSTYLNNNIDNPIITW